MKLQASVLTALMLMMPVAAIGNEPAAQPAAAAEQQQSATPAESTPAAAPETTAPVAPEASATTAPAVSDEKVVGRIEKEGQPEKKLLTFERAEGKAEEYSAKYVAYTYTIKNTHTGHLEILQGEVLNAVDEQIVAAEKVQKGNTSRRIGGALFRGVVGGVTSFVPYAGLGGYYAAAATNHVAGAAANAMDATAYNNMALASGRYTRKINNVIVGPNNTYQITALVPKKAKPVLKVVVKDLKTNEITDIQE